MRFRTAFFKKLKAKASVLREKMTDQALYAWRKRSGFSKTAVKWDLYPWIYLEIEVDTEARGRFISLGRK